jgi:hypothetical protein
MYSGGTMKVSTIARLVGVSTGVAYHAAIGNTWREESK